MYRLYIDESGDEGDYVDSNNQIIRGSSRYFTAGGLIVKDPDVAGFNSDYDNILSNYFNNIILPTNFKLHYYPLRHNLSPYNQLTQSDRNSIEQDVFDIIFNRDCTLLSVTIDLQIHCTYPRPANPRAYSLLLLLERFQYFLEDQSDTGIAIYERFNAKMRKKTQLELKWLQNIPTFPVPTQLNNIRRRVVTGDPTQEPILNFADFFAYLLYQRRNNNGVISNQLRRIIPKYYNLNGGWLRTGWVEL